jgi:hypothetical protein
MSDIQELLTSSVQAMAKRQSEFIEAYLLECFGTLEAAEKYGKNFVLDIYDEDYGIIGTSDTRANPHIHYYITYRLRPKTEEELESELAENAERDLHKE